jgi:hypothetical protein
VALLILILQPPPWRQAYDKSVRMSTRAAADPQAAVRHATLQP